MMDEVEVMGKQIANPFGQQQREIAPAGRGLISVEQQKAVAEVQARMIIARSNPRDVIRATDLILQDCTRPTLAQGALYQYSRGGTDISGPSIRLAEAIAGRWGNIASGIKEISRNEGYSECIAYAWDLESGYYDERQFQVRHWRDTNRGGYQLRDERDIYELIANMGQRRKRAVLLTVIPGDVVEAAVEQCEETLRSSADTSPDALKKMVEAFGAYGVTQDMIEKRIQRRLEAVRPAQIIQLRRIYNSLKDGVSEPSDWFGADPVVDGQIDQWRNEREGKQTKPEFLDMGSDRSKLIAQGNAICHDPDLLKLLWNDHFTREQRVVLGAGKGRDYGPVMTQWSKGLKFEEHASSEEPAEPPVVPDTASAGPPQAGPQEDAFGLLPLPDDEAACVNILAEIQATRDPKVIDEIKERWQKRMDRLPRPLWLKLGEDIGKHETALQRGDAA